MMNNNFFNMDDDSILQFLGLKPRCTTARETPDYRRYNRPEPTVRRPHVEEFAQSNDTDDRVNSNIRTNNDETTLIEQLQLALNRQIEETNRMNKMYVDATKRIGYLENENAAYKSQLDKFYKIQGIMNGEE